MYILILMVCQSTFHCTEAEIIDVFPTMATCEAAMEERFPELESGQATMCIENSEAEKT